MPSITQEPTGNSANVNLNESQLSVAVVVPTEVIPIESTPTVDYASSFYATAVAIAQTLPSPSPVPGWSDDKQPFFSNKDLMIRASGTTRALYPPPPDYYVPTVEPNTWPTPIPAEREAGDGIIVDESIADSPPFSLLSDQIHIVNHWVKVMGDQLLIVVAGSAPRNVDALQGKVLVALIDRETFRFVGEPSYYETPGHNGKVQVIDAVGERLTLRAADGTLFYFDVPTSSWVNP